MHFRTKFSALTLAMMFLTLGSASLAVQIEAQPGYVLGEFIYEEAPFAAGHASTLAETPLGLVAAWFGGTEEKHPDVGIWFSRHLKGQWTAPVEVANGIESPEQRYPTWNPVLYQAEKKGAAEEGPLLLFYKMGPDPSRWWGMLITSDDHGATWSEPTRLPEGYLGPIKNKPIRLPGGDLICPASFETEVSGNAIWQVYMERTPDLGKTWSKTKMLNDGHTIGAIQPSILVHSETRLQALGRSRQGKIWVAWSEDAGKSWGPMTLGKLPNPSSGTDAVTLADGRHLLVYNHTPRGRSPLNVALSKDGVSWRAALILENESGEYSYPAMIQTRDRLVHVTYTWNRERVKHVVIDPGKLKPVEIVAGQWPR